MQLFEKALSNSFVHVLYRDELLLTHQYLHQNLDIYKSYRQLKLTELLNDTFKKAITDQPLYRRERRKYIRPQLKELALIFADQPALLGNKRDWSSSPLITCFYFRSKTVDCFYCT
jgi:hypothetical protein